MVRVCKGLKVNLYAAVWWHGTNFLKCEVQNIGPLLWRIALWKEMVCPLPTKTRARLPTFNARSLISGRRLGDSFPASGKHLIRDALIHSIEHRLHTGLKDGQHSREVWDVQDHILKYIVLLARRVRLSEENCIQNVSECLKYNHQQISTLCLRMFT